MPPDSAFTYGLINNVATFGKKAVEPAEFGDYLHSCQPLKHALKRFAAVATFVRTVATFARALFFK